MNSECKALYVKASIARQEYRCGIISRQEAKEDIMPYINYVNNTSIKIAKKYNQKPKLVNFSSYIR